ncbi:hypothetical protein B0H16DRAFT_1311466, partial [Mycena metata]
GTKRVLIPHPKSYKAAVDAARRHFPAIKAEDMVFQTKDLAICDDELIDIAPESWDLVIDLITSILHARVFAGNCACYSSRDGCTASSFGTVFGCAGPFYRTWAQFSLTQWLDELTINFKFWSADIGVPRVTVKRSTTFRKIHDLVAQRAGLDSDDFVLLYDGARLDGHSPQTLEMCDGDSLEVMKSQLGGKPVIYLYSPTEIDATVMLTLTREWSFSAVYPVVPTKIPPSCGGQRIRWDVRTHLDGNLTETTTALDVAYLFWEAHTNHGIPDSPPASPGAQQFSMTESSFSPLTSDLYPADSVLLSAAEITTYLDKVLLALGLHTEARASFITYWLPSFLKHKHVALRFVPQAAYEAAAALDISPTPDVITRLFMLFKGIADDDVAGAWAGARAADNDGERWLRVVGLDAERTADASLFRVLEWGGMEVLGR